MSSRGCTEAAMRTVTPRHLLTRAALAAGVLVLLSAPVTAAPPDKLDSVLKARAAAGRGTSRVIVRLRQGAESDAPVRRARGVGLARFHALGAQLADVNDADLASLAADPDVLSVHADRPIAATTAGAERGSAASAKAPGNSTTFDGRGVRVAVIDSGVSAHDDLSA